MKRSKQTPKVDEEDDDDYVSGEGAGITEADRDRILAMIEQEPEARKAYAIDTINSNSSMHPYIPLPLSLIVFI